MAEQFKLSKMHVFKKGLNMVYPIVGTVGMIAMALIAAGSGGLFGLKSWAPIALIGMILWAIYDIRQFIRALRYQVALEENRIVVNGTPASWNDIKSATAPAPYKPITLQLQNGTTLDIDKDLEGLSYVYQAIESKINKNIAK